MSKKSLFFILILNLLFSAPIFAEDIFSKDGVSFSIETPPGFATRTLPREDVVYLAVGNGSRFITSASVQMKADPKRAALLQDPGMKPEYLLDGKKEKGVEAGSVTVSGAKAYYIVALSKEFMKREQKDLFQVQKKIVLSRGNEVFTLSFAATGWTIQEAGRNFDSLRPVFESMLSSFRIK